MTGGDQPDAVRSTATVLWHAITDATNAPPEKLRPLGRSCTGRIDGGVAWQDFIGPGHVEATVGQHRDAVGAPDLRLAAALLVSEVLRSVVWLNVACLTLVDRVFDIDLARVRVEATGGRVLLHVDPSRVAVLPTDLLAGSAPVLRVADFDALAERCHQSIESVRDELVTAVSGLGRVPRRLIDCDVAMTWHAVLRWAARSLPGHDLGDLSQHQWHARPGLWELTRQLKIATPAGGTRDFTVRRACCLEYRLQGPTWRTYCGTCPLVPDEALTRHREALDRGQNPPPLTDADRARPVVRND